MYRKLLFILLLLSSQAGAVTWDYILDFEDATTSDIGDTTTLFGDTSGFGNDNCAIYANGGRQTIVMGTPSGTWLPSGWGDNAGWDNALCQRHGVVQQDADNPTCSGTYSYQFNLSAFDTDANAAKRSELTQPSKGKLTVNETQWVSYAVYIPSDFDPTNLLFPEIDFQVHGAGTTTTGHAAKIPFSLRKNTSGNWIAANQFCGDADPAAADCNSFTFRSQTIGTIAVGEWNLFLFRFNFGFDNANNNIKVWFVSAGGTDPVENSPAAEFTGPNMLNTGSNPFVKMGLYKSTWRLAANRQTSIDAGRPTTKKWVDSIVFSKDATFDEMVAKAFPNWACASSESNDTGFLILLPPSHLALE